MLKGDDKDVIEKKARRSRRLGFHRAAGLFAAGRGRRRPADGGGPAQARGGGGKDEVLDAEFEEVQDKDQQLMTGAHAR